LQNFSNRKASQSWLLLNFTFCLKFNE